MNTNNEISDLIVKAYKHQKNGDLSLAIQGWNALINHSSTDKELISNAFLNLGNLHLQQGNEDLAYERGVILLPDLVCSEQTVQLTEQRKLQGV